MGDVDDAILDDVAYIGLKNRGEYLRLYKCMENAAAFETILHEKLARSKTSTHEVKPNTKNKLREYLKIKTEALAKLFNYTIVTDFENDHLLTVAYQGKYFVYFGAMTATLIHVACWLLIPRRDGHIDLTSESKPKIVFWVLHTSYAQELEALSDLEMTPNANGGEDHPVLDLTDVPENL